MKKTLLLAMISACLGIMACSGPKSQQPEQQVERGFTLPEVPVVITEPEERAAYVANHYWDNFDFTDTVYIHLPDITEQAAVNFMDLLQRLPQDKALAALTSLMDGASAEPKMTAYFWDVLSRYWYDPNSPMKNEDMFILLCKGVEQSSKMPEHLKERAAYRRTLAEKNRPGAPAEDFVYTLESGRQGTLYGLKAPYTLLFFYNPDCHTCADIKRAMNVSGVLKSLTAKGQVKVLTLYPDEDVELWRNHLNEMASHWVNGYDKGQVLTIEKRYDLSSIPSFYLLDKDKKVVLKDADWEEIINYLENK